jgi:hypothetical protein
VIIITSDHETVMTKYLPILALAAVFTGLSTQTAEAGGTGYYSSSSYCADSKFQTPRYNQVMPYRHFQDRRRYNAAPCCGDATPTQPYLVKTVVVSKKRICNRVTTVYKNIYSNGSCYVWSDRG